MSTNDNTLTGNEREAITEIHAFLRTVKISKPEIDAILAKIPSVELSRLMESVSHLDRNNCLTRHTFEKISVRTGKNNFNLLTTYHIIKALDRQGILNPRNMDLIFNSNSSFTERRAWRQMMPNLIDIGYFNQSNIDRIFLHQDFENLMRGFSIFCDYRWFFSSSYLDKMIAQNELGNLHFILSFIPDTIWQDWDKLNTTYDKLLQCDAQFGNLKIVENAEKKVDYRDLDEESINNLLDRCIAADTPEAAVKVFADQPRPLTHEEMNRFDSEKRNNAATLSLVPVVEQQSSSSRVERSVRSLPDLERTSRFASNLERSVRSIGFAKGGADNTEYSSQNRAAPPREGGVTSHSVNDTLLLGGYVVSSLLQYLGFKDASLANAQPALNESAMDFKAKKVNHLAEQLHAAEKQYEENNNSSFVFSSGN